MVRPLNNLSIEISQDEIYGGAKGSYVKYIRGQSVKTNLSLEAIILPNQKEILRIEVED